MRKIRFASFTWLLLIPIFAAIKIAWELYKPTADAVVLKPFPVSWLDSQFPANVFIGVALIVIATYFVFAYINAYLNGQTTYTIALFFSLLSLLSFTPELTSSLLAILLFMNGVIRLLALTEKKKHSFVIFDAGLFTGLALILEGCLFVPAIFLSLFLFRFSSREFLRYWAGIFIPLLFVFPILHFSGMLPSWQQYTEHLLQIPKHLPKLAIADYTLLSIVFLLSTLQALNLYKCLRKPSEYVLLFFLFIYFISSLFVGIVIYPMSGAYILFIVPSVTILYSLSRQENHRLPILFVWAVFLYWVWQEIAHYVVFR